MITREGACTITEQVQCREINSGSNRSTYKTLWAQTKKWINNLPGCACGFFFLSFFHLSRRLRKHSLLVTHLTAVEPRQSRRDAESHRVPSVPRARRKRQCLLLLDYWTRMVQPTATRGAQIKQPMGTRPPPRVDQSKSRFGGWGWEEGKERRRDEITTWWGGTSRFNRLLSKKTSLRAAV